MPEIGTSGLMSGDGKRGDGLRPQATAPILDSTTADLEEGLFSCRSSVRSLRVSQPPYKHRSIRRKREPSAGGLQTSSGNREKIISALKLGVTQGGRPRPRPKSPQFALLFFVTWFLSATILPRLLPGAGGTKYAVPLLKKIPTPCPAIP